MASTQNSDVILKLLNMTQEDLNIMFNVTLPWNIDEIPFTDDLASVQDNHSDSDNCECGAPSWLRTGAKFYTQHIHGVAALSVCIVGAIANILNLVVLTRRELRVAPVNRILCCLALADVLVMLEYIPFAYELHLDPERARRKFQYSWAFFFLIHMHFAQVLHTTSIMLTLLLASWRCLTLAQFSPTSLDRDCSKSLSARRSGRMTRILQSSQALIIALVSCLLLPIILCTPSFFCFSLRPVIKHLPPPNPPETKYFIVISELAHQNGRALYKFHFWFYAVLVKLLPCVLLTALSACLIRALLSAQQHSLKLLKKPESIPMITIQSDATNTTAATQRSIRTARRTDRTTRMLVAVTLLFLVTELPQGVLGVLSSINGPCFFLTCYQLLGDMLDMLALLNGAVNFILYCAMSRQFRATFCRIFIPASCVKCAEPRQPIAGNALATIDTPGNTAIIHAVHSENYSNV